MIHDIAIMVFALIAIFTGKKWAIITATIWFIVTFIIGLSVGILTSNLMSSELLPSEANEVMSEIFSNIDLVSNILFFSEIFFIIIGWIRVIFTKKKTLPPELN